MTGSHSLQLLACEFSLTGDSDLVLAAFDELAPRAVQDYPISQRHHLDVHQEDGCFRLREDGRDLGYCADAQSVVESLYARMYQVAMAALSQFTKLHAGCAVRDSRRLVVVGPTCSGKSTLMTRLLFEGFDPQGDDVVLAFGADVIALPRRFRIRPAAIELLPEIAELAPRLPVDRDCLALDPSEIGLRWVITAGAADVIVFLASGDGQGTRLEPCPKHVMAERIMRQSSLPSRGAGAWVKDVCSLVERADCYVLYSGRLASNVAALKSVVW